MRLAQADHGEACAGYHSEDRCHRSGDRWLAVLVVAWQCSAYPLSLPQAELLDQV
jgi:hypothetical protein